MKIKNFTSAQKEMLELVIYFGRLELKDCSFRDFLVGRALIEKGLVIGKWYHDVKFVGMGDIPNEQSVFYVDMIYTPLSEDILKELGLQDE